MRLPKGTTLDLEAGCARGACVGMTMAEVKSVLGEPTNCDDFSGSVSCQWAVGVSLDFVDTNHDKLPDLGAESEFLTVSRPFDGATASGLGLGVSMRCFAETYGEPVSLNLSSSFTSASFGGDQSSFGRISVDDFSGTGEAPDGRADSITVFQALVPRLKTCRITAADCPAERPRCALTLGLNGAETSCKPSLGTKAEGEVCTRPTDEAGIDDCAPGLYCSGETAPLAKQCRRYCEVGGAACGAGEACAPIYGSPVGRCLTTCPVFGTTCPAGLSCTGGLESETATCVAVGPKGLGEPCDMCLGGGQACTPANSDRCQADLQCIRPAGGNFVCSQVCDSAHPCKAGSCTKIEASDAYGFCSP